MVRQPERAQQLVCIATQREAQSGTHLIHSRGTKLGHTLRLAGRGKQAEPNLTPGRTGRRGATATKPASSWASGRGAPEPWRRKERSDDRSHGEGAAATTA